MVEVVMQGNAIGRALCVGQTHTIDGSVLTFTAGCLHACRLLAAMVPGQPADPEHPPPAATTKQYGPNSSSQVKHSRQTRHHQTREQQSKQNSLSQGSQQRPQGSGQLRGPSAVPPSTVRQQQTAAQGASQSTQPRGRAVGVGRPKRDAGSAGGQRAEQASAPPVEPAQVLTLQEDEVDWESNGAADPALQHALAVIRAKGDNLRFT